MAEQKTTPEPVIHSINEPQGSTVMEPPPGWVAPPEGGGGEPGALALTGIEPDHFQLPAEASDGDVFTITATGTGFDQETVLLFDDEEMETTFVDAQHVTASIPVPDLAGEVDVEVQRGEELSDVIAFEFINPDVVREKSMPKKAPVRKPAKAKDAPRKQSKKAKR